MPAPCACPHTLMSLKPAATGRKCSSTSVSAPPTSTKVSGATCGGRKTARAEPARDSSTAAHACMQSHASPHTQQLWCHGLLGARPAQQHAHSSVCARKGGEGGGGLATLRLACLQLVGVRGEGRHAARRHAAHDHRGLAGLADHRAHVHLPQRVHKDLRVRSEGMAHRVPTRDRRVCPKRGGKKGKLL